MGEPDIPRRNLFQKRRLWFIVLIAALAVGIVAGVWRTWKGPVEEAAKQAVADALGPSISVKDVEIDSLKQLTLKDVSAEGAHVDEVRLEVSAIELMQEGAAGAVRRVELVRPQLELGQADAVDQPLDSLISRALQQWLPAGIENRLPEDGSTPDVIVTDGVLFVGGHPLVTGIQATVEPGEDGLLVRVTDAQLMLGDVPWDVNLAFTHKAGALHGLSVNASRGDDGRPGLSSGRIEITQEDPAQGEGATGPTTFILTGVDVPVTLLWHGAARLGVWTSEDVQPPSSGTSDFEVRVDVAADAPLRVEGEAKVRRFAWSEIEAGDTDLTLSYTGATEAEPTGAPAPWRAAVTLLSRDGRLYYHAFDTFQAGFDGSPSGWEITGAQAQGPEGAQFDIEGSLAQASAAGSAESGGLRVNVVVSGTGVPAQDGARWVTEDEAVLRGIAGALSGQVRLEGPTDALVTSGALSPAGVRFRDIVIDGGESRFTLSQATGLDLDAALKWGGGQVSIAEVSVTPSELSGNVTFARVGAPALVRLGEAAGAEWSAGRSVRGRLGGSLQLHGELETPQVSGEIHGEGLGFGDIRLDPFALHGTWAPSGWRVSRIEAFAGPNGPLITGSGRGALSGGGFELAGDLHADDGTLHVSAGRSGENDTSFLSGSVVDFPLHVLSSIWGLEPASGRVTGSIHAEAPFGRSWGVTADLSTPAMTFQGAKLTGVTFAADVKPDLSTTDAAGGPECAGCLYGSGSLLGRVAFGERAGDGEAVSLKAAFKGDRVVLEPVDLTVWGGRLSVEGTAVLDEHGEWTLDARSRGQALHYRGHGVDAHIDYRLALTGPWNSPRLGGVLATQRAELDLFQLPRSYSGGGPVPSVDLGLTLDLRNVHVTARSLLDGEAAGLLEVKGTLAKPEVYGDMMVRRGTFRYLGTRFQVDQGAAAFSGVGFVPRLDVTGTARTQGARVSVEARGPADDLSLEISSDPALPESEILELLGVPSQRDGRDEGDWKSLAGTLAGWVGAEVESELYWRLGRALEQILDVDDFQIGKGNGAGRQMQLTVGKYLTPEFYVSYSRILSRGADAGLALEYSLTPRIRVKSEWGPQGETGLSLGVTLPF